DRVRAWARGCRQSAAASPAYLATSALPAARLGPCLAGVDCIIRARGPPVGAVVGVVVAVAGVRPRGVGVDVGFGLSVLAHGSPSVDAAKQVAFQVRIDDVRTGVPPTAVAKQGRRKPRRPF